MADVRVLLVDDQPEVADLTATYLERVDDDISVHVEHDAESGLARLDGGSFDCVVSDFEMDGMDGLELLADVRAVAPGLPFILFTGKGSEEIASDAISAGVTDYLQKQSGTQHYDVLANRIHNAVAQHRARQEADRATERMRRVFERVTDAFFALDDEWTITYANERAVDFFDRPREELVGEDVRDAFPGDDADEFKAAYAEAFERQEPVTLTNESVAKPGRWVEERIYPSEDGLSVYFRDVTERRRREQTLDTLHDATRELMGARTRLDIAEVVCETADSVLGFPGTGVRLYDHEREALVSVAVSGETAEEVDSRPVVDLEDAPQGESYLEAETVTVDADDDTPYDLGPFQRTMHTPMGEYGVLSVGNYEDEPFTDSDVRFAEVLTANARAALDRADRERQLREREQELERQNDRLEEFANVVSHDLRNPLNVARGHLEVARETGRPGSFDRVTAAHNRMEALIEDLLALARDGQTVGRTEEVSLATVAERAWKNVATPDAATLEVEDGTVEADDARLCTLLENLFRNAVEHGSTGSQPRTDDAAEHGSTSTPPADEDAVEHGGRDADRSGETASGTGVDVTVCRTDEGFSVADDGPGIPPADREDVFEHGYSTDDDGIGLGLAIVKDVADAHGWTVTVAESEAGGARFDVTVE